MFGRGSEQSTSGNQHLSLVEFGVEYNILVIPADDKWDWERPLEACGNDKIFMKANLGDDGLILQMSEFSFISPKRVFPVKLYFRRKNVFIHVHLKPDVTGSWPKEVPYIDEKQQTEQLEKIGKIIDDAIGQRAPQVRFERISPISIAVAKATAIWDQCVYFVIGGGKDTN